MKEKANIEADRLIELYKTKLYPREQFNKFIPDLVKQHTIEAAIIDVLNTIKVLESLPIQLEIAMRIKYYQQVKQILEEKLPIHNRSNCLEFEEMFNGSAYCKKCEQHKSDHS